MLGLAAFQIRGPYPAPSPKYSKNSLIDPYVMWPCVPFNGTVQEPISGDHRIYLGLFCLGLLNFGLTASLPKADNINMGLYKDYHVITLASVSVCRDIYTNMRVHIYISICIIYIYIYEYPKKCV